MRDGSASPALMAQLHQQQQQQLLQQQLLQRQQARFFKHVAVRSSGLELACVLVTEPMEDRRRPQHTVALLPLRSVRSSLRQRPCLDRNVYSIS